MGLCLIRWLHRRHRPPNKSLFVLLTGCNLRVVMPCSSLINSSPSHARTFAFRLAYRAGVSSAITAPSHSGFPGGLRLEFSLGARHKLEKGAVHQDVAALHLSIVHGAMQPSVSTQIGALRQQLFAAHTDEVHGELSARFADVVLSSDSRMRVTCLIWPSIVAFHWSSRPIVVT